MSQQLANAYESAIANYLAGRGAPTAISAIYVALMSGIAEAVAPVPTTATTGGTILAGTYPVAITYVNASGETAGSANGSVTTTGTTSTITIPSPVAATVGPGASAVTGWYAYVGQAGGAAGSGTRQQTAGSPTAIGTGLTLTATPTNTGAAMPVLNTTAGYTGAGAGTEDNDTNYQRISGGFNAATGNNPATCTNAADLVFYNKSGTNAGATVQRVVTGEARYDAVTAGAYIGFDNYAAAKVVPAAAEFTIKAATCSTSAT